MNLDWADVFVIALVGYAIVFFVLALLVIIYKNIPKFIDFQAKRKLRRQGKTTEDHSIEKMPAEVNVAIALALSLYLTPSHDEESHIITIKRVSRTYSPWNSKIYGVSGVFSR
ncbi:MAG TPA: OadG family protein [Bacteroidales bacterium]|jgi:Na+-transporting methylmalonyl-CoA/oxaloacetate decarboxylase gamma subunit|nr:OadG family protein [Bacteroidales bacterium]